MTSVLCNFEQWYFFPQDVNKTLYKTHNIVVFQKLLCCFQSFILVRVERLWKQSYIAIAMYKFSFRCNLCQRCFCSSTTFYFVPSVNGV